MIDIHGRVIAITGGAAGIGYATASLLKQAGATVVIGDVDDDALAQAVSSLPVDARHLDVTDEASFAAFVDGITTTYGRLDVLVNNAGVMPVGPFLNFTDRVLDRNFQVNLLAVVRGTRLAARQMIPQGYGHIVNVASVAGLVPLPGLSIYSSSKAGLIAFSEAVEAELRPTGVKVLTILPNFTRTALISGVKPSRFIPVGDPETVAAAIVKAIRKEKYRTIIPASTGGSYAWMVTPRFIKRAYARIFGLSQVFLSVDEAERAAYQERLEHG